MLLVSFIKLSSGYYAFRKIWNYYWKKIERKEKEKIPHNYFPLKYKFFTYILINPGDKLQDFFSLLYLKTNNVSKKGNIWEDISILQFS